MTNGLWHRAFTSFSEGGLHWGSAWNPTRGGAERKPVPGAPRPAETAEARLRQMRELARGFGADIELRPKDWHTLRLLPKPLARYGKAGGEVVDGALFAFVLATDPEVFLLLEARSGPEGTRWEYGFASEASAPLRAAWKGKPVWDFAYSDSWNDRNAPYFNEAIDIRQP